MWCVPYTLGKWKWRFNTTSVRIECFFLSNRLFTKLVRKMIHALQSTFSDSPTLCELFDIICSLLAFITTYLNRVKLTQFPVLFFLMFESRSVHFFLIPFQNTLMLSLDYFRYHIEAQVCNMFIASMVHIQTSLFGISKLMPRLKYLRTRNLQYKRSCPASTYGRLTKEGEGFVWHPRTGG